MNLLSSLLSTICIALALGAAFISDDAQASTLTRFTNGNAANYCQSALPVFDVQIRKRPLAVQNEGGASAFVTCSYTTQGDGLQSVKVFFASTSGAAQDLTCTGVAGTNDGSAQYSVKVVSLEGDGNQGMMAWSPEDFGGVDVLPGQAFSISCNLMPQMGVNQTSFEFQEEIGG